MYPSPVEEGVRFRRGSGVRCGKENRCHPRYTSWQTLIDIDITRSDRSGLPLPVVLDPTALPLEMGGTKVDAIHHQTSMELKKKKKGLRPW